jgi:hypothetical protein
MQQEIRTNDLVSNGYMIIESNHVPTEVKDTQVSKYWDDLPLDTYMGDGGTYIQTEEVWQL